MKGKSFLLSLILFLVFISSVAQAATSIANSRTYFDASGNIVGHQYMNCENLAEHAGVLNSPYYVAQEWICPEATKTCTWNAGLGNYGAWVCAGTVVEFEYDNIVGVSTPSGITAIQICTERLPGEYNEIIPCTLPAPEEEVGVGLTYSLGWD
jgi:hypothetical protein